MRRRDLLVGGLSMAGLGLAGGYAVANGTVRVLAFIPSDEKSRNIEKKLAPSMGSIELTVFGRAKDLENSVAQLSPEAVIAPEPTLRDLGLSPALEGKRSGSTTEPYVLITVDKPASPQSMAAHTVGVFGIMGHSSMKKHCQDLLGTTDQKIKTVTKYADLLPLLQFQAARGVVLPKRFASTLTSRSTLKLVLNEIPGGRVGLTSVAIPNQKARSTVVSTMQNLDGSAKEALGVEGWQ